MNEIKCPEADCQQRVSDVHHALFSTGGVRDCVRKKISYKALAWIIPVFASIIIGTGGFIYRAHSGGQKSQDAVVEKIDKHVEKQGETLNEVRMNQTRIEI